MGEEDRNSREFVEFIRSNRDMIMKILGEEDREREPEDDRTRQRSDFDRAYERMEERRAEARERMHDHVSDFLKVMADDEVQKHFFTGCMEFLMCVESVFKAMPKSSEMDEVVDSFERAKKASMKNAVVAGTKAETREKLEKVSITNIKKKIHDEFLGSDDEN
ncbi:MAG: hypothetical protein MJZ38_01130 [archaeon]|nr:hypothetical protein [archaeon]